MRKNLTSIVSKLLSSNDICKEVLVIKDKEIDQFSKILFSMTKSLCEKGVVNLGFIIKNLIRKFGSQALFEITKLLNQLQRSVGKISILEIDAERFLERRESVRVYGIDKIDNLLSALRNGRLIIAITERFHRRFMVLPKIFEKLFDQDPKALLAFLAIDIKRILWNQIENFAFKELDLRPPLEIFLTIFHAAKEYHDLANGVFFLEDMARRLGLAARSWARSTVVMNKVDKLISKIRKFDDPKKLLVYGLNALIDGLIDLKDIFVLLVCILNMNTEWKRDVLVLYGCIPSDKLMTLLDKFSWDEILIERICRKLTDAEKQWAPDISISDLFGLPWLSVLKKDFLKQWIWEYIERLNTAVRLSELVLPEEFWSIIRLALVLAISNIKCSGNACSLIARSLLSMRWRLTDYPLNLISLIVSSLMRLNDEKIALAVYLERILEIHGPETYLYVLDKIFPGEEKRLVLALNTFFSSRRGVLARKVISKAMKRPEALKSVNDVLKETNFRPHGITIPLVWELNFHFSPKLIEITNNAINYFTEVWESPPRLLILFKECLEAFSKARDIKKVIKSGKILDLIENCPKIIAGRTALQALIKELRRIFGTSEARLIKLMVNELSSIYDAFSDKWERIYLENYKTIISEDSKVPVVWKIPSIVKEYLKRAPVILIVIDGLRYDDYIIKIKPALIERKLRLIEEKAFVSMLPSVTTVSRRAIFGGLMATRHFSQFSNVINLRIIREDEYLRLTVSPNSVYIHGAIARILKKLRELISEKRKIDLLAIVISELEKAAHGAAEGFLAHITIDYINELLRVLRVAIRTIQELMGKIPYIVITTDHGLEIFTKATEIEAREITRILERTQMLDPVHEPLLMERFSIFPFLRGEAAKEAKERLLLKYSDRLYVVLGDELGYEKVGLKLKHQEVADAVPAENVIFIFPRGRTKFVWERRKITRIVLHGGISPVETIIPFAVFRPEGTFS
ncbi:MAG: PglZ domain-containing protein [Candidatus Njordarchaeales archaeon]